jgi:fructuronate reductase
VSESIHSALSGTRELSRAAAAEREGRSFDRAPVRIVHLGLGAFHRAHQAWYTDAADEANEWGIRAFTGRSATAAEELAAQDGLYSLIERSADGDSITIVDAIVDAVDGARVDVLAPKPAMRWTPTAAPIRRRAPWHPMPNGCARI